MDLKGLSCSLDRVCSGSVLPTSDGWGPWEVNPTVALNAYADYRGDDSIAVLGTSDTLVPIDHYLI